MTREEIIVGKMVELIEEVDQLGAVLTTFGVAAEAKEHYGVNIENLDLALLARLLRKFPPQILTLAAEVERAALEEDREDKYLKQQVRNTAAYLLIEAQEIEGAEERNEIMRETNRILAWEKRRMAAELRELIGGGKDRQAEAA